MSATGQSWVASGVVTSACACASLAGIAANRLVTRSRNEPPEDDDDAESRELDVQPANAARTSPVSAYVTCRNALPHVQPQPVRRYSRSKVACPRPVLVGAPSRPLRRAADGVYIRTSQRSSA